jgi:hypothetical protein
MVTYDQTCTICIDNISLNSDNLNTINNLNQNKIHREIIKLECNHTFHLDCIKEWFQKQLTCPSCRGKVTNDFYNNQIINRNVNIVYTSQIINQLKNPSITLAIPISPTINKIDKTKVITLCRIIIVLIYLLVTMINGLFVYTFVKTNNYIAELELQYNQNNSSNSSDLFRHINSDGLFILFTCAAIFAFVNIITLVVKFKNNFKSLHVCYSWSFSFDAVFGFIIPLIFGIIMNNNIRSASEIIEFDNELKKSFYCIFVIYMIMIIINHILINNIKTIIKFIITKIKSCLHMPWILEFNDDM